MMNVLVAVTFMMVILIGIMISLKIAEVLTKPGIKSYRAETVFFAGFILTILLAGVTAFYCWLNPYSSKTISTEITQDNIYEKYIVLDKEDGKLRYTRVKDNSDESIVINVDSDVKIIRPHKTDKKKPTLTYTQNYSWTKNKLDVDEIILEIPNK